MDNMKSVPFWQDTALDANDVDGIGSGEISEKTGNQYDQRDMVRMGKKQELRRDFQFFSIWGYAVILG